MARMSNNTLKPLRYSTKLSISYQSPVIKTRSKNVFKSSFSSVFDSEPLDGKCIPSRSSDDKNLQRKGMSNVNYCTESCEMNSKGTKIRRRPSSEEMNNIHKREEIQNKTSSEYPPNNNQTLYNLSEQFNQKKSTEKKYKRTRAKKSVEDICPENNKNFCNKGRLKNSKGKKLSSDDSKNGISSLKKECAKVEDVHLHQRISSDIFKNVNFSALTKNESAISESPLEDEVFDSKTPSYKLGLNVTSSDSFENTYISALTKNESANCESPLEDEVFDSKIPSNTLGLIDIHVDPKGRKSKHSVISISNDTSVNSEKFSSVNTDRGISKNHSYLPKVEVVFDANNPVNKRSSNSTNKSEYFKFGSFDSSSNVMNALNVTERSSARAQLTRRHDSTLEVTEQSRRDGFNTMPLLNIASVAEIENFSNIARKSENCSSNPCTATMVRQFTFTKTEVDTDSGAAAKESETLTLTQDRPRSSRKRWSNVPKTPLFNSFFKEIPSEVWGQTNKSSSPTQTSTPFTSKNEKRVMKGLTNSKSKVDKFICKSRGPRKMPDFAKIHQRVYEKLENIKDFQERKAKRAQDLLSGSKPNCSVMKNENEFKKRLNFSTTVDLKKSLIKKSPAKTLSKHQQSLLKKGTSMERSKQLRSKLPVPIVKQKHGAVSGAVLAQAPSFPKQIVKAQVKAVATKSKVGNESVTEKNRNAISHFRSNRRYELLLKMRQNK